MAFISSVPSYFTVVVNVEDRVSFHMCCNFTCCTVELQRSRWVAEHKSYTHVSWPIQKPITTENANNIMDHPVGLQAVDCTSVAPSRYSNSVFQFRAAVDVSLFCKHVACSRYKLMTTACTRSR